MSGIVGSVGRGGKNSPSDVKLIQTLLNRRLPRGIARLNVDGLVGPKTLAAITEFQRQNVASLRNKPTAVVFPGDHTWRSLTQGASAQQTTIADPAPTPPAGAWPAKFTFEQFWAFTEPLEGGFAADCMFMVKDLQVATGMGITFSNKANRNAGLAMARALEWNFKPGHPQAGRRCSAADIERDYDIVLGMESIAKQGSGFLQKWKDATICRITKDGLKRAVQNRVILNIKYLKTMRTGAKAIGDFDSFSADAQLCIVSISWAMGNEFNFPKFCDACRKKDWTLAQKECGFSNKEGTHFKRQADQELMMHNALCVAQGAGSPDVLHWPKKLEPKETSRFRESRQISLG